MVESAKSGNPESLLRELLEDGIPNSVVLSELAGTYGVCLVVLFGSVSKGTTRSGSDMDLGILLSPGHPKITLELESTLASALWRLLRPRCELDLVILNHCSPLLKRNVARSALVLFADPPWIWRAFRIRAFREFEDGARFRYRSWQRTLRSMRNDAS